MNIRIVVILFFTLLSLNSIAQSQIKQQKTIKLENQVVEAACGECQFKLSGKSCDLAIRYKGKAYFVDGTKIDDHGDAHEKDGFCNAVRKAEVTGTIEKGRFKATAFKLVPAS